MVRPLDELVGLSLEAENEWMRFLTKRGRISQNKREEGFE
jgi:hypothetical protein